MRAVVGGRMIHQNWLGNGVTGGGTFFVRFAGLCLIRKHTTGLFRVNQQHWQYDDNLDDPSKHQDLCGCVIAAQETCRVASDRGGKVQKRHVGCELGRRNAGPRDGHEQCE